MQDFDVFYPERMASRILGLGDVATLAEQAKKAFDSESSAKLEEKFVRGEEFTFEDFLEQLQAMSKMGNMSKLLGMLPGAGAMKKQIENFDEGEIIRSRAIVESMTPVERSNPKLLNGSRRARIARGSGRNVSDVNNLVDRFAAAQKLMKQVRSSGMPPGMTAGMPGAINAGGIPAMPAGFSGSTKNMSNTKKKSKSGNPAKRALEEGRK
jgi:signal recognition particle subunit SRP54